MDRQDRIILVLLPIAVMLLMGVQDCGDASRSETAPPVFGELQQKLADFLTSIAATPPQVIPPPGWIAPDNNVQTYDARIKAFGFSVRGDDRPLLNPRGEPAVVELHQMFGPNSAISTMQLMEVAVGNDRKWEAVLDLFRGDNYLGARTRIGGFASEFAVIHVTSETGRERSSTASIFDYPVGDLEDGRRSGRGWYVAQDLGDTVCYLEGRRGQHLGEDWNLSLGGADADVGHDVYAVADGEVIAVGRADRWGHYVVIRHVLRLGPPEEVVYSFYGHLSAGRLPHMGNIDRGAVVGQVGSRRENGGWSPHLHFEIRLPGIVEHPDWRAARAGPEWPGLGYSASQVGLENPTDAANNDPSNTCGPGTAVVRPGTGWIDRHR